MIKINHISLHPHYRSNAQDDSLAQQVEHIPFKDGVLGSNPRRITKERSSEMKTFSFLIRTILLTANLLRSFLRQYIRW